jgi:hypothetical protein
MPSPTTYSKAPWPWETASYRIGGGGCKRIEQGSCSGSD